MKKEFGVEDMIDFFGDNEVLDYIGELRIKEYLERCGYIIVEDK